MIGRIWPPSFSKTAGGKCDYYLALFLNRQKASTRNTNPAVRMKSSNPAVLRREDDRGKIKTGAVPSRKSTEFAPGYYFLHIRQMKRLRRKKPAPRGTPRESFN